ncbi:transposase [Streptodolium elevatio]
MTDAEWAVLRASLSVPAWLEGRGGQPEAYCHRQMVDAVRYLVDNGIKWRAMPADFPPWDRVYAFFARWRDRGLVRELHDGCGHAAGRPPAATRRAGRVAPWWLWRVVGEFGAPGPHLLPPRNTVWLEPR